MNNTMNYKGYIGSVEFTEKDGVFFGKVQGIHALISYEGETAKELVADFHAAVDDYLEMCERDGVTPETAFKGSFNVRVSPELHRKYAEYALNHQVTMNQVISEAMAQYGPVNL